jgi:hypothetical protein
MAGILEYNLFFVKLCGPKKTPRQNIGVFFMRAAQVQYPALSITLGLIRPSVSVLI